MKFTYEMNSGRFEFEWSSSSDLSVGNAGSGDGLTSRETEIYLPSMLAHGRKVVVRGLGTGDEYEYDERCQTLTIRVGEGTSGGGRHRIEVTLNPPLTPLFAVNTFWGDFGLWISMFAVVFVAILAYTYL